MLMSALVLLLFGLIIFLIVRIVTRKQSADRLRLRDIGTILDRTVWDYRQHLVGLLLISALCVPLGNVSSYGLSVLQYYLVLSLLDPWGTFTATTMSSSTSMPILISMLITMISLFASFGVGKTVLMYKTMQKMRALTAEDTFSLEHQLQPERWDILVGLVAIMIIPWLLFAFLGLIGAAVWLSWSLAPVVVVYEGLGPVAAVKRSYQLVRGRWSSLLNTLVPLWVIGWLIIGVPLYGSLVLLHWVAPMSPDLMAQLAFLAWLVGSIFVAPLGALGARNFYLEVRDRERTAPTPPRGAAELHWEGHSIALLCRLPLRYAWMAYETLVLVDNQKIARSRGFWFKGTATGSFLHNGLPCAITMQTRWDFLVWYRVLYQLEIDGTPASEGKLVIRNLAILVLLSLIIVVLLVLVVSFGSP